MLNYPPGSELPRHYSALLSFHQSGEKWLVNARRLSGNVNPSKQRGAGEAAGSPSWGGGNAKPHRGQPYGAPPEQHAFSWIRPDKSSWVLLLHLRHLLPSRQGISAPARTPSWPSTPNCPAAEEALHKSLHKEAVLREASIITLNNYRGKS